ncbi:MAG: hypothetical protein ACOYJ6_20645 [Caulobacterales bacterium]
MSAIVSSVIGESSDQVVGVNDPTFRRFSMTTPQGGSLSSYTTTGDTTFAAEAVYRHAYAKLQNELGAVSERELRKLFEQRPILELRAA